jgi:hypothetical protein
MNAVLSFDVPSKYFAVDVALHSEDSFLLEEADSLSVDWACGHYLAKVARIERVRKANRVARDQLPRLILSLAAYDRITRGYDETLREAFQASLQDLVDYYLLFGRSMTALRYGFGAHHRFEWLAFDGRVELPLVIGKDQKLYHAPFHIQLAKGRSRLSRRKVKAPEGMKPMRLVIVGDDEMIDKNHLVPSH